MDARPQYVDFALMDECKTVANAPSTETITGEHFAPLIPSLASRWENERKTELIDALRKTLGKVADSPDPLNLAVAIFPCTRCDQKLFPFFRYPAVLGHPCGHSRGSDPYGFDLDFDLDLYEFGLDDGVDVYRTTATTTKPNPHEFFPETKKVLPFELKNMSSRSRSGVERALKNMYRIVKTLGLDPMRATFEELMSCEARLRCGACAMKEGDRPDEVFAWEAAVSGGLSSGGVGNGC